MEARDEMKLPAHVKRMARGGMSCMHCGGSVEEDGYSSGGIVEDDDMDEDEGGEEETPQDAERDFLFAKALRGRT